MQAIEVTTFRLTNGLSIEDFLAANADVDAWLLKQPGFLSRRIAQRDDGVVVCRRWVYRTLPFYRFIGVGDLIDRVLRRCSLKPQGDPPCPSSA